MSWEMLCKYAIEAGWTIGRVRDPWATDPPDFVESGVYDLAEWREQIMHRAQEHSDASLEKLRRQEQEHLDAHFKGGDHPDSNEDEGEGTDRP